MSHWLLINSPKPKDIKFRIVFTKKTTTLLVFKKLEAANVSHFLLQKWFKHFTYENLDRFIWWNGGDQTLSAMRTPFWVVDITKFAFTRQKPQEVCALKYFVSVHFYVIFPLTFGDDSTCSSSEQHSCAASACRFTLASFSPHSSQDTLYVMNGPKLTCYYNNPVYSVKAVSITPGSKQAPGVVENELLKQQIQD